MNCSNNDILCDKLIEYVNSWNFDFSVRRNSPDNDSNIDFWIVNNINGKSLGLTCLAQFDTNVDNNFSYEEYNESENDSVPQIIAFCGTGFDHDTRKYFFTSGLGVEVYPDIECESYQEKGSDSIKIRPVIKGICDLDDDFKNKCLSLL